MAFKLDKGETARRAELCAELVSQRGTLEDALAAYNAAVEELKGPLVAALVTYNAVVEEARLWAEDIAATKDGEFDEKSERWQEGNKGQAAREFIDAWQNEPFEEIEIEFPDELSIPDDELNHDSRLEGLPEQSEE